jgi:hypothetical protein
MSVKLQMLRRAIITFVSSEGHGKKYTRFRVELQLRNGSCLTKCSRLILKAAREINCHGRAVSWTTFDLDASTVLLYDLGAGREPET